MKMGTRSLLFGVHQALLHPLLVGLAWYRLYGFRRVRCPASGIAVSLLDPRLWIVLLVHDWGYWGCPDMNGERGKLHPVFGSKVAGRMFGPSWEKFSALHSRSLARRQGLTASALCAPDKLAVCLYPEALYLLLARASGELWEYMGHADSPAGRAIGLDVSSPEAWYRTVSTYMEEVCFRIVHGGAAGVPPEDITVNSDGSMVDTSGREVGP